MDFDELRSGADLGLAFFFALGVKGLGGVFSIRSRTSSSWANLGFFLMLSGPVSRAHALQLGYICISWAELEADLNGLLAVLIPLNENEDICAAVTGSLDLRSKIQILTAAAFVRKPFPEWFDHLQKNLDHIDNGLRPVRNRYVHDYWGWNTDQQKWIKGSLKVRIKKPQAFQRELSTSEIQEVSAEEMEKFDHSIRMTCVNLRTAAVTYQSRPLHETWRAEYSPQFLQEPSPAADPRPHDETGPRRQP